MPELSRFYGLVIILHREKGNRHKTPHFHVSYSGNDAVYSITSGRLISGYLPTAKKKLIAAWYIIHKEELLQCWEKLINGDNPGKVAPLK